MITATNNVKYVQNNDDRSFSAIQYRAFNDSPVLILSNLIFVQRERVALFDSKEISVIKVPPGTTPTGPLVVSRWMYWYSSCVTSA